MRKNSKERGFGDEKRWKKRKNGEPGWCRFAVLAEGGRKATLGIDYLFGCGVRRR